MLALLDSAAVTLAVVFGIPLAIGVVIALGVSRRIPIGVVALASVVTAGVVGVSVWAVLRPPAPQATGSLGPVPPRPSPTATSSPLPSPSATPASSPTPAATCEPSGAALQETAKGIAFEKICLAAPAGRTFTIAFTNADAGIMHDIHIFSANPTQDPNAQSLFIGEIITGPQTVTYQVGALPAGTYFFHCDVHPLQMQGTFVAG